MVADKVRRHRLMWLGMEESSPVLRHSDEYSIEQEANQNQHDNEKAHGEPPDNEP
jgi:hypothetical protein